VNRERPKREGEISVNFTVKQPLPVSGSGHHILSVNPCSLFLSSHSITRASSWGREEEKPRVRGNGGMRETKREREQGNWRNWNRERGMGIGELGDLEPRREGNGNSAIGEC